MTSPQFCGDVGRRSKKDQKRGRSSWVDPKKNLDSLARGGVRRFVEHLRRCGCVALHDVPGGGVPCFAEYRERGQGVDVLTPRFCGVGEGAARFVKTSQVDELRMEKKNRAPRCVRSPWRCVSLKRPCVGGDLI